MSISVDHHKIDQNGYIQKDTILFRLASPLYSSLPDFLNGKGALAGDGRYHRIHQLTSYVSDSAILCIAEVLYHMSRKAMAYLANKGSPSGWRSHARILRHLVVFDVHQISDLIYVDTKDCRQEVALNAQQAIPSTIIVHPDCVYDPLQKASDHYRKRNKKGVLYPSARHSQNLAAALYLDHTRSINNIHATLKVTLSLVEEGTNNPAIPPVFDPDLKKISQTLGHYAIDANDFSAARTLLIPGLRQSDTVEFVRRP